MHFLLVGTLPAQQGSSFFAAISSIKRSFYSLSNFPLWEKEKYINMYMYICACIYVCVYMCMYIYGPNNYMSMYKYIHTLLLGYNIHFMH